jgi:non-specific protein-tyrosine kinase
MNASSRVPSSAEETTSSPIAVARRRWWVIALTTCVAVGIAVAGLSLVTPTYSATATLQAPIATGVQTPSDLTYVDRLMNTYTQLAQQASLRSEVARDLGRRTAPALSVVVQPNTELLELSASDPSAATAQRAANDAATVLVTKASGLALATSRAGELTLSSQLNALSNQITAERRELAGLAPRAANLGRRVGLQQAISGDKANYTALVGQRAQLQLADAVHNQTLSVVQSAALPTGPASPRWPPVLALAIGLGLLGGLALAFLLERFVPRLYTVEAIATAAEADVLVAIPHVGGKTAKSPLYNGGSSAQEAFGVLAVHVLAGATSPRAHTILVTSHSKGDGKSTVASNLATELAKSGHLVLLVDADLRSPSVHRMFGVDGGAGLSNLLEIPDFSSTLGEFIVNSDEIANLDLLPAGPLPPAAARLLASERLARLVAELNQRYEFIIFDAPPLVVSDPLSIARLSDLVLLVVGGDAVPDRDVQMSTRKLTSIGAEHISVVVNRWRGRDSAYSYSYGRP